MHPTPKVEVGGGFPKQRPPAVCGQESSAQQGNTVWEAAEYLPPRYRYQAQPVRVAGLMAAPQCLRVLMSTPVPAALLCLSAPRERAQPCSGPSSPCLCAPLWQAQPVPTFPPSPASASYQSPLLLRPCLSQPGLSLVSAHGAASCSRPAHPACTLPPGPRSPGLCTPGNLPSQVP